MKKTTLLLTIIFLFSIPLLADKITKNVDDQPKTGTINVVITGIRNNDGVVLVGLYNQADTFLKRNNYYKGLSLDISNKKATGTFTNIPYGTYAIAFFHDENKSGKMDYSFIGFPLEGFGFSNNFKPGLLSQPKFDDAKFNLETNCTTIEMTTNYL